MSRGPGGVYAIPSLTNANAVKECEECQKSFTIFRPKYHCRNCGKYNFLALSVENDRFLPTNIAQNLRRAAGSVVCANCSEHRNDIPKFGYQKYVGLVLT